jgi:hypothetical protein
MISSIIVFLLLTLLVSGQIAEGRFEKGSEAYKRSNYATVLKEFRPLAERGNAASQYILGLMYVKEYGVSQDEIKTVKWYRKAAEQGYAIVQNNLGVMYDKGYGVSQDYKEAVKWYRKAANQGNANAQNNLGGMYALGRGVPKNYVFAYMWWNIAGTSGDKRAIKNRDIVAKRMTLSQIEESKRLARAWKPKKSERP